MSTENLGFCPFRIQKRNFESGCVLQLGKDALCYSQDLKPLQQTHDGMHCPLLEFSVSMEIYECIEQLITPIMFIQDEQEIAMNLWPILTGMAKPKINATSEEGRELQERSQKLRGELEKIICDKT